MNAGELLTSRGWTAHPQNGDHPLWSKDGSEPVSLSAALEIVHAETAKDFEATIRAEWRDLQQSRAAGGSE
jgi:hypothetical protein